MALSSTFGLDSLIGRSMYSNSSSQFTKVCRHRMDVVGREGSSAAFGDGCNSLLELRPQFAWCGRQRHAVAERLPGAAVPNCGWVGDIPVRLPARDESHEKSAVRAGKIAGSFAHKRGRPDEGRVLFARPAGGLRNPLKHPNPPVLRWFLYNQYARAPAVVALLAAIPTGGTL